MMNKSKQGGFTLLEVMVAMMILALGFISIMEVFSGGSRMAFKSEQYLRAISLAENKLTELELENFKDTSEEGSFEDEDDLRWRLSVQPYETPVNNPEQGIEVKHISLDVFWEENGEEKKVQIESLRTQGWTYPAPDDVLSGVTSIANFAGLGEGRAKTSEFATSSEVLTPSQANSVTGKGENVFSGPGITKKPAGTSDAAESKFRFDISGNPIDSSSKPSTFGLPNNP